MFLTNNDITTNNLMIYSRGIYTYKIIHGHNNDIIYKKYYWTFYFQKKWSRFLKFRTPNSEIDFTVKPYGNMKYPVSLITNTDKEIIEDGGKLVNCYCRGDKCF